MAVVLVVNDDTDMLETYGAILPAMGHEPITKMTLASGPETVRDVGADALLVDLQQPDEDAYGVRIIEALPLTRGRATSRSSCARELRRRSGDSFVGWISSACRP